MGILKRSLNLEEYFKQNGIAYNLLTDSEYGNVVQQWKHSFEENLIRGVVHRGAKAVALAQEKLPSNVYVFTCPNYPFIDNCTHQPELITYGYLVQALGEINREAMCGNGAIACDLEFSFMCAFIFEGIDSFPEKYAEKNE